MRSSQAGFPRVRFDTCHAEYLVAFSCKRRGICPRFGARRMDENSTLLVDEAFPGQPVRQWVLSVPYPLRFRFTSRAVIIDRLLKNLPFVGHLRRAGVGR